jgi:hypothetical protein
MPTISVNDNGVFKAPKEILVNDSGTWKAAKEIYIKDADAWKKAFPESGTQTYATAGTYFFVVPNGIYSLSMPLLVGAGGGGGGSVFSGDGHGAANGGSGGFHSNKTIAVTPNETLTVIIGAGGSGGTSTSAGSTGGITSLQRGTVPLFSATGGTGGAGVFGDNGPAFAGAGGSPSGVAGSNSAGWMVNRNTPGQGYDGKGQNGTGYGAGGLGGNSVGGAAQGGTGLVGGTGYISLSW